MGENMNGFFFIFILFSKIIFRNPTPRKVPVDFKPAIGNVINYLEISNKGLTPGEDPHLVDVNFWDELFNNQTLWNLNKN